MPAPFMPPAPTGVVPPPPQGPGVVPPFVAPPTDGTRQRRWLAIGLAGGAALLLCVGGLFGLGGLVVLTNQAAVQQSKAAVTNYLSALRERNYSQAYDLLCPQQRSRTPKPFFEAFSASQPRIVSFTVAEPQITSDIVVPATVSLVDGSVRNVKYLVVTVQVDSSQDYEVCGQVD